VAFLFALNKYFLCAGLLYFIASPVASHTCTDGSIFKKLVAAVFIYSLIQTLSVIFGDFMQELLNTLDATIGKLGARACFNKPASKNEIENLEDFISVTIPSDLKEFYLTHNGGFFATATWTETELSDKTQFGLIHWNSNHFLTLEKIKEIFSYVDAVSNVTMDENPSEQYIPFFQTKDQEYLVLQLSKKETNKPILKLVRQTAPEHWIKFSNDFAEFLERYIEKKGDILTY